MSKQVSSTEDTAAPGAASHTVLSPRTFTSLAGTMFAVDLLSAGNGAIDLAFVAPFGVLMVAGIGLGDLVTALFMAFFAGIVDVFAVKLARAEGRDDAGKLLPTLFAGLLLVAAVWTAAGLLVSRIVPLIFDVVGSEPTVAAIATDYLTVRMIGIPFTLALAAVSITLRIVGRQRASILLIATVFVLNAAFNAALVYGPLKVMAANPVMAVAIATVIAQVLTAACGFVILVRHFSRSRAERVAGMDQQRILPLTREMFTTSLGVGLRQMNNYAAAVVPFMLISRLDVGTVAAAAVATRIWTLYCRVPQATLGAVGVFVGYSRGRSQQDAHAVVQRSRKYVVWPSFIAAAVVAVAVPVLAKFLGGGQVDVGLVWTLTAAYLIAVPAYVVENLCGEILTVEQRAAWLSLPSTVVTFLVTIPIAVVGILVWESALVAVASAAAASLLLALRYSMRTRQLGYRLIGGS
ncbi:MATE family efflux transporter [Paenarthrobacter sp. UW852]|uniref:MATE family efflux transporter n=1 Tax=Paenarthrobacter sp. UW852 TaxID=2951989 RepID=UPI002147D181|nr:MATE family efflux transporter [Paenarthrobacter sp. UW852]MCR1163002.1 MATE family efflux transporter [Paenarthrobacter sp. UW852]